MTAIMDRLHEEKTIKSAWDSPTFDMNVEIPVADGKHDATDIGSATISPSGRDVAIASKAGLDIIDLDSPLNQPRHLRHNISWNVADVQWSPFAHRDYWVGSTANQKALIWNLNMQEDSRQGAIEHTLHAHTRAITDINFSAHHPDILATCAVDGYVNAWDLRRARKPVMTFVDWDAGATQVKWNRQNQHIIASSHDRYLRIWDSRHGAYPVKSIEAHTSKIYGVDWSRTREGAVVTCSLDRTIKFWDYTLQGNSLERTIKCDYPVWRARHTPFPNGLLAMPQTPGDLFLYDLRVDEITPRDDFVKPVATFKHKKAEGEVSRVKEFLWRSRGTISEERIDDREFQLVSWGDDKKLQLQRVPNTLLESAVGHFKGREVSKTQNFTRKGAVYKTFRNVERAQVDKKSATISGPKMLSSSHDKNSYNLLSDEIKKMSPAKRFRSEMRGKGSTMRGKTTENERRNQINWMRGIKFDNGNGLDGKNKLSNRRLSVISPNFDTEADWDAPESLHEEIIRLHSQFSKVKFETDMDKRMLTVSMNGPWGERAEPVYLTAKIRFPDHYPGSQVPEFQVEKTSRIPDGTYGKITKEVNEIAASFVGQRRGCLEATICYLLGEVDLEESQSWLKGPDDTDMIDDALAASSSESDDDDDVPPESSTLISASQELDPSTDGLLNANRRHMNVPLPRLCGARFSSSGKLVCFFPPKEDKFKSLLGSVGFGRAKADHEPSFNTFSRLALEGLPKRTVGTLIEASDHESDSSGDGSGHESDSSDSDSSQFQQSIGLDFWKKIHSTSFRKGLSTNRSNKSSGIGTGTGIGTNNSRGRATKSKNTIALHDLSGMLPAKVELAREYALYGEGADVCDHNAAVARKHGYQDLADIWTYAGMLLQHEVPLAVLNQSHRQAPILVVARDMIKRTRKALRPYSGSDSGVDVSYSPTTKDGESISGRVKWGYCPLAKQLIDDLFAHFSLAADCQMLAMLSCIFTEPSSPDALPNLDIKMTQPQTPLSMKTPAFSLDYFPSDIAAWSAYSKTPYSSIPGTPMGAPALTPVQYYGSLGSSNGPWGSDPTSSFSAGNTPPLRSRGGSIERLSDRAQAIADAKHEKLQPPSQTHSLSTSPEDSRSFRRANSGLAASFAANLKNPFMSSGTAANSPPAPALSGGKGGKRPSPVESMVSALTPSAVTWGNTTYLESVREKSSYPTSSYSDEKPEIKPLQPVTGISVTMWNQSSFDDEGCISIPLLETASEMTAIYKGYRRLYAELLFAWQLPYTRLEILKFDSMPDNTQPSSTFIPALSPATTKATTPSTGPSITPSPTTAHMPYNKVLDKAVAIQETAKHPPQPEVHFTPTDLDLGLSITAYCLKHENRLSPLPITPSTINASLGGAVGRCERCNLTRTQLRCVICMHPITADYVACLNCGCASHTVCAEEYFGTDFEANSSILNDKGQEIGMRKVRKGSDGSGEMARMAGTAKGGDHDLGIGGGTPCPAGCECECLTSANQGVVESWEVMMGAIDVMRKMEAKEAARALKKSSRENSRQGSRSNSHARIAPLTQLVGGKGESAKAVGLAGPRRATEEWDEEAGEWEGARRSLDGLTAGRQVVSRKEEAPLTPTGGGMGFGKRLGQVRASDGLGWVRKKSSSLRNGESS